MNNNQDVIATFNARAEKYNKDMSWLEKPSLVTPLVPLPFGGRKAFDVCTGTGLIAKKLHEEGWDVVAGDISDDMLSQVGNFAERVLVDVCVLPFEDNVIDLVTCRQGLQYVDLEEALRSMSRVSATEIRLGHITVNDIEDLEFWSSYYSKASPGRKNVLYPGEIASLAERIGLQVVEQRVIIDQASLTMTINYMDEDKRNQLISSVVENSQEFKRRNGVCELKDGTIVRDRRWEFITCSKTPGIR